MANRIPRKAIKIEYEMLNYGHMIVEKDFNGWHGTDDKGNKFIVSISHLRNENFCKIISIETGEVTYEAYIYGIKCDVFYDNVLKCWCYRFTVPGWKECTISTREAAERVIRGRLSPEANNPIPSVCRA